MEHAQRSAKGRKYTMTEKEITKALRWFAKVTTHCEHNIVSCPECEFHGFCTDPYSDDGICKMHECLTAAASLIESLQAQLATEKRRADAAVEDMKLIVDAVREAHCDENCCFACKFDCDTSITDSGCYANECTGFERDDCFEWRGPQEAGKESR